MELFKFNATTVDLTYLDSGELLSGIDSAMWIERYRDPGEFSITGKLSSGLLEKLPLGSFVSHSKTLEVMIVEDHQLDEDDETDPEIEITGRSLESFLEHRIVGMNQNWATPPALLAEYVIGAAHPAGQAVTLINDHILPDLTIDDSDALNGIFAYTELGSGGPWDAFVIKRGTVHERALELLSVADLGIRVVRRNSFGNWGVSDFTAFVVHAGVDRTDAVIFSKLHGDIRSAQYLWSNRREKNAALVVGRYVETPVYLGPTGYARRMMVVDGSDLDDYLSDAPTGAERTEIINKMIIRGQLVLNAQNQVNLTRADISKNAQYQYRKDYDVGDIITINGNYGETAFARVVEYVEIEDENGESGHPTLELL